MLRLFIQLDHSLRLWVLTHRLGLLNPVMWLLSVVGRGGIVWLAAAAAYTAVRRVRPGGLLQLAVAVLLASLLGDRVLKPLVDRERPFAAPPVMPIIGGRPADASFPSGHAANAFAGAYVLSRLVPEARFVWWTLAWLIACSRVYLGVHYPSDVIGGAVLGWLCGLAVHRVAIRQSRLLRRVRSRPINQ